MDLKTLIARLHEVFYNFNEKEHRHSRVWLTEGDEGIDQVTFEDHFILVVVVNDKVADDEVDDFSLVLDLLDEKARDLRFDYIERVRVYNYQRPRRYHFRDHLVYTAEKHAEVP